MSRLEVLLATRKTDPETIIHSMRVHSPIVIASQTDSWGVTAGTVGDAPYRMYSTGTTGVGINRNIALGMAREDYLLFADDDVVYNDGYAERIVAAFEKNPRCDVLILRMQVSKGGQVFAEDHFRTKRIGIIGSLRFGTYQIAVRRRAVEHANIHFTHQFGGGCPFSAGEDSLFLTDCFRHGLRVYTYDYLLGVTAKDVSSWYTGFNKKFFYDKGVFADVAFPKMKYLFALYIAIRQKSTDPDTDTVLKKYRWMCRGIRHSRELLPYEEREPAREG